MWFVYENTDTYDVVVEEANEEGETTITDMLIEVEIPVEGNTSPLLIELDLETGDYSIVGS